MATTTRKTTDEGRATGQRLRDLRAERHLTQQQAARMLGVGYRTYQSWEAGATVPRWGNRVKLARMYGIRPEEITGSSSTPMSSAALERIEAELHRQGVVIEQIAEVARLHVENAAAAAARQERQQDRSSTPATGHRGRA